MLKQHCAIRFTRFTKQARFHYGSRIKIVIPYRRKMHYSRPAIVYRPTARHDRTRLCCVGTTSTIRNKRFVLCAVRPTMDLISIKRIQRQTVVHTNPICNSAAHGVSHLKINIFRVSTRWRRLENNYNNNIFFYKKQFSPPNRLIDTGLSFSVYFSVYWQNCAFCRRRFVFSPSRRRGQRP